MTQTISKFVFHDMTPRNSGTILSADVLESLAHCGFFSSVVLAVKIIRSSSDSGAKKKINFQIGRMVATKCVVSANRENS